MTSHELARQLLSMPDLPFEKDIVDITTIEVPDLDHPDYMTCWVEYMKWKPDPTLNQEELAQTYAERWSKFDSKSPRLKVISFGE